MTLGKRIQRHLEYPTDIRIRARVVLATRLTIHRQFDHGDGVFSPGSSRWLQAWFRLRQEGDR